MKAFIAGTALVLCAAVPTVCRAQPGKTYPRVVGASGGLYGPTQAHYQYQRRYGHAWTGSRGISRSSSAHTHGRHFHYHSYQPYWGGAYSYGAFGYPAYIPQYTYAPSIVIQPQPIIFEPDPFDNDVLNRDQQIEDLQRLKNLIPNPADPDRPLHVKKSNAAGRQRSLHLQGQGDISFRERRYAKAYSHYRQAIKAAQDLSAPYFRTAFALSAMGHFESAVRYLKQGLRLDPKWPLTGEGLDERFGQDGEIAKNSMLHKVAQWVREDIRDPDRLFLVGVLLHFNNDIDRAMKFFEAADQMGGSPRHVRLFLNLEAAAADDPAQPPAAPAVPKPPQPMPEGGPDPEPVQDGPVLPNPS